MSIALGLLAGLLFIAALRVTRGPAVRGRHTRPRHLPGADSAAQYRAAAARLLTHIRQEDQP